MNIGDVIVKKNLFDKYGGVTTIKLILEKFYKILLSRMWAKKMFINVDMEKLLLHQIQFVSFAMGKPESEFDDERLRKGHAGLKITEEQYEETIDILVKVLTDFRVKFADIKLIGNAIESKKHLIVNVPVTKSLDKKKVRKLNEQEQYNKTKLV